MTPKSKPDRQDKKAAALKLAEQEAKDRDYWGPFDIRINGEPVTNTSMGGTYYPKIRGT